jgi:MerR family transcriptional regulator, light-induced transcriptional regulator
MPDRPSSKLIRTIEGEIVPRLLVSLTGSMVADKAETLGTADVDPVVEFARLLLDRESAAASAFVRKVYPPGTPATSVCLGLMAPAARRLGELWEREECGFDELLAGLSRIESLLREVGASLR